MALGVLHLRRIEVQTLQRATEQNVSCCQVIAIPCSQRRLSVRCEQSAAQNKTAVALYHSAVDPSPAFTRRNAMSALSTQAELHCRCGEVRGLVTNASARTVNRVVCYCDDCQAFAHQLGRADLLDAHGGTDIVQVAPASLKLVQGQHRIVGLRLTPNGLFRWYASCCNTPMGNVLRPAIPFVGIVAQVFDNGMQRPDQVFGKPVGAVFGQYAIGDAPAGSTGIKLSLMLRTFRMVLGWRLRGQTWPHPYFARDTRAPIYPLTVLSHPQREALRPLCGPQRRASGHSR
jgi:hypothetical protein